MTERSRLLTVAICAFLPLNGRTDDREDRLSLKLLLHKIIEAAPDISEPHVRRYIREQMTTVSDDMLGLGDYPLEPVIGVLAAPVYKDECISAAMIGLRSKGDSIPLHDHRNMYGFTRVVRGRISIESYSWPQDEADSVVDIWNHSTTRSRWRARYEGSVMLSADDLDVNSVAVLTPKKRNVRSITAMDDETVLFDVLVPGYNGRKCRYYTPEDKCLLRGRACWLKTAHRSVVIGRWLYKQIDL